MIVKSTQRQGMRGPRPPMVSCGGAAIPGNQRFDVVEGSVRIYVRSMAGGPGRGLSSAAAMTRYWSPSSAWPRHGGGRAVWGGAQVVTFDMSGSGGGETVWGEPRTWD
jgi:hypothetical protein